MQAEDICNQRAQSLSLKYIWENLSCVLGTALSGSILATQREMNVRGSLTMEQSSVPDVYHFS